MNALIEDMFPGLRTGAVRVQILLDGDAVLDKELVVLLDEHLGLGPIDVAKLGLAPLRRRIEDFAISHLHAQLDLREMQKRGWVLDRKGFEAAGLVIEMDMGGLETDVTRAAELWHMAHAGQPLSAEDLSNAASPAHPLTEEAHVAALQGAASELWERVDRLETHLREAHQTYRGLVNRLFKSIANSYQRRGQQWGDSLPDDRKLRQQVTRLHGELMRLERLDLDGSGMRPAAARLVEDMVDGETGLRRPIVDLEARQAALRNLRAARNDAAESLPDARANLKAAIAALRVAVGVETLAVFPVLTKSQPLTPLLLSAQGAQTALGPWPRYRARLARLLDRVGGTHLGFPVHPDATRDDTDPETADTRDEREAPRAYHRGIFLARASEMTAPTISGIVVDEWVETRPGTQQEAAIALNYDSPQAEAPNCILLAVPEDPFAPRWDGWRAAGAVEAMLDLMRIRALTTQTTPLVDAVLPLANRVAHVGGTSNARPRLPVVEFPAGLKTWFEAQGQLRVLSDTDISVLRGVWNQTGRFGPRRRIIP